MKLVDANEHAEAAATGQLPGKVNYFVGKDPARWRAGIPAYARTTYREIYRGIDLTYYGNQRQLEYDFVVRPGSSAKTIGLRFEGADRVEISAEGELLIHTSGGVILNGKPHIYQVVDGRHQTIAGGYVLNERSQIGFEVGSYDTSRPLVIDPTLAYSTYLGGGVNDTGTSIAVDASGNAYVTGFTNSIDFPTTPGVFDGVFNGGGIDAFVTKLNATGLELDYSTYLGGSGLDIGWGIALDESGSAYVTGLTGSDDFPTTAGAFDTMRNGNSFDAFVTKLNATGSALDYSTYLGGSRSEGTANVSIRVDATGSAYVTGDTNSADFPTTPLAFDTTPNGNDDVFVTKLNATGSGLVYSTYLGGSGRDLANGIALDSSGNAYVTGSTDSANAGSEGFPTTPGAYDIILDGTIDAFVTKLDATGSYLDYSTFLGGSETDVSQGIALDASRNAYVAGYTSSSTDFPTTAGAFDTTYNGGLYDAFVTKLNATGSVLAYSTYLGGSDFDAARGISVDESANAHVTGQTSSTDFPMALALQSGNGGFSDAFVTRLNGSGSALRYSTYLGGGGDDAGNAIAVDAASSAYVTGHTRSTDFPTTPGAFDTVYDGGDDGFVARISDVRPPATVTLDPAAATNPVSSEHCVTATVKDAAGNPLEDVSVRFAVTGSVNTSGSATTDANGQAEFCYQGPSHPGTDAIHAYADSNADNTQDPGEPDGTATKIWVAGPPATLTLDPPAASNQVGSGHCVTATVRDAAGNPVPNVTVQFAVTGSVNTSGSATTGANGQAEFCYQGPSHPGTDAITAYADTDGDGGTQDPGEPGGAATKIWVAGPPATLTLDPPAASNQVGSGHCVTATVRDAAGNPVPNVTVQFAVTGSVNTSGSATTGANGQAVFCYQGPSDPGTDAITAYADTDGDGTQDPGEPGGTATKIWVAGPPATLTLDPAAATNPVDSGHCVTATVRDAPGNPVPDVTVRFAVTGSVNTGGSAMTDAAGQAHFCYQGPSLPGTDLITAYADTDDDGTQDPGEPSGTATKAWVAATNPSLCTVTNDGWIIAANGDRASFSGHAQSDDSRNESAQEHYRDNGPRARLQMRSIEVLSVVCQDETQATIYGRATVDGSGPFNYRIIVKDLGEPAQGLDTYRLILDSGYDSGEQVLRGGNVQIKTKPRLTLEAQK